MGCSTDMSGLDGKTSTDLASDYDTCYVSMTGVSPDGRVQSSAARHRAREIILARKIDCGRYANQIAAIYGQYARIAQQQNEAMMKAGTALMIASQPKPVVVQPLRTPVQCRQRGQFWECY
jgi:hypothetical protein